MKTNIVSSLLLVVININNKSVAQPPAGKYDSNSYPADRKSIKELNYLDKSAYLTMII